MHGELHDVKLMPGDALLIDVPNDQIEHLTEQRVFLLVSEAGIPRFNRSKATKALTIVAAVVVIAASGLLPIVVVAVAGALMMVMSRCISSDEAYGAIEWKVLFLLAGMLSLGAAMQKSGASALLAKGMIDGVGSYDPTREANLRKFLHGFLDRQPGIRVFSAERRWRAPAAGLFANREARARGRWLLVARTLTLRLASL